MKKTILAFFLSIIISQSHACYQYGENEELMMSSAVILKEKNIINLMLNEYCINFQSFKNMPSFFFSKDVETLKFFDKIIHENYFDYLANFNNLDILSYVLLKRYILENPDSYTKDKLIKNHQVFIKKAHHLTIHKNVNKENFNEIAASFGSENYSRFSQDYYQSKDYKDLIGYLSKNKNLIVLSKDQSYKNTAMHYAFMLNNKEAIKGLLSNNYLKSEIFKKNIQGFTPIHLYLLHSHHYMKEDKEISDLILSHINKIDYLDENVMPFKNFIYLLKNEHPYFYSKMKEKFGFNVDEKALAKMKNLPNIWKNMSNYLSFLKEKIKE